MKNLEKLMDKAQEIQIDLMKQYVTVWDKWLDNRTSENMEELQLLKHQIEHLSMGLQLTSVIEKINQEQNIVVPKQSIIH